MADDLLPPSAGAGRPATLLVCDLKGSTALAERLDAETWRAVLTEYFAAMRAVIESYGGRTAKIIGDAIVAVFDGDGDASLAARRATAAAVTTRQVLDQLNGEFSARYDVVVQNRTGLASGEVGSRDGATDVLAGDVMTRAEALEAGAPPMEVLVDDSTARLVGDAATLVAVAAVSPKRGAGSFPAWQLLGVDDDEVQSLTTALGDTVLTSTPDPGREDRRTVTVLFADPRLRPANGEALDSEVAHEVMSWFAGVAVPIAERHGGTVEKFVGDALMVVFGLPTRREDDAARALRAADELRSALLEATDQLQRRWDLRSDVCIGVNTGAVVAGDASRGERMVTGDTVNVAARLAQTAERGQVICGELTVALAGDTVDAIAVEPLRLRGKSELVAAYSLVAVRHVTTGSVRRHQLPLIGRSAELATLQSALDQAIATRQPTRLMLLGDAGVGKSRLVHEFLARVGGAARVVRGGCLSYGQGITYWPLLRVIHDAAGVVEHDDAATARAKVAALVPAAPDVAERLQSLAGLHEVAFAVGEQLWALRRMLERLAAQRPVVVVLDDLHWAEPALLDAIDEVTAALAAPALLLGTARRSMADEQPAFVDAATQVVLRPFDRAAGEEFLRLLVGTSDGPNASSTDLDRGSIERILDASGGNPLFLEQLLSMLVDDGRLREVNGSWQLDVDLADVAVPPTIEAVLAARLDLLTVDQRTVIEPAAVIGMRFPSPAIAHLVPADVADVVPERLDELAARELVDADAQDPEAHRFQHQLVREATYQGMLKQTRAALHERFVEWGDATNLALDRATEFEAIQGHHLELAYRYRCELGPLDERTAAVGLDAARRLQSAGERALAQGDVAAAGNLLQRAVRLLPAGHPGAPALLLRAGRALHESGAFDEAIAAYDGSADAAAHLGDESAVTAGRLESLRLQYLIGRVDDAAAVERAAADAIASIDASRQPSAASRAWQLRLNVEIAACRWAAAQEAAAQVIELAGRAGDHLLEVRTMPLLAFLAQKGPMPVDAATVACEAVLARVEFDRRSSAMTQLELAMLSAMHLDVEVARRRCADTRAVLDELGWQMQSALVSLASGPIEMLLDEPERAEAELRADLDALRRMGERNFISLTIVLLADAVYRQSRWDEAAQLLAAAHELVAPDDVAVEILLGTLGAKLAARAGDHRRAAELLSVALDQIDRTDDPSGQADARLDAAEIHWLAGDLAAVRLALAEADARYVRKGNLAGRRRVELVAERLGARSA